MTLEELEIEVTRLQMRPPVLVCMAPDGQERKMTVQECRESGSDFIYVVVDDLDALLADELKGVRHCDR